MPKPSIDVVTTRARSARDALRGVAVASLLYAAVLGCAPPGTHTGAPAAAFLLRLAAAAVAAFFFRRWWSATIAYADARGMRADGDRAFDFKSLLWPYHGAKRLVRALDPSAVGDAPPPKLRVNVGYRDPPMARRSESVALPGVALGVGTVALFVGVGVAVVPMDVDGRMPGAAQALVQLVAAGAALLTARFVSGIAAVAAERARRIRERKETAKQVERGDEPGAPARERVRVRPGPDVFRDRQTLRFQAAADLPDVCLVCGARTKLRAPAKLTWTPGWTWALCVFAPLPGILVARLLRQKVAAALPLCAAHLAARTERGVVVKALALAGAAAVAISIAELTALPALAALGLWLLAAIVALHEPLVVDEIKDDWVCLRGVDGHLLEALPIYDPNASARVTRARTRDAAVHGHVLEVPGVDE